MIKTIFVNLVLVTILMSIISFENASALLNKNDRYAVITLENLKSNDVKITVYVYDQEQDTIIKGAPEPADTTANSAKYKFKWNNENLPKPGIVSGTEIITCIELTNGEGQPSCVTDKYKSESQSYKLTMDVDNIRGD